MTNTYIDENLDTDLRVFFNLIGIPSLVAVFTGNVYYTFLTMFSMFIIYEFVVMDVYYELYSEIELKIKRNTLSLCYVVYGFFLFIFGSDLISYLKH